MPFDVASSTYDPAALFHYLIQPARKVGQTRKNQPLVPACHNKPPALAGAGRDTAPGVTLVRPTQEMVELASAEAAHECTRAAHVDYRGRWDSLAS